MKVSDYKSKIVEKLILDDKIAQALLNKNTNFLNSTPLLPLKLTLKNKNVFPYFLIAEAQSEIESYIFSQYDFNYNQNGLISRVSVEFKIFTHVDLNKTDVGVLRSDFICNRIKELFNRKSDNLGANFYLVNERDLPSYNEKYFVNRLIFETTSVG